MWLPARLVSRNLEGLAMAVPRLSIGLPVYNGEKFVAESLDSLLGQTYEDFELLISDNASTDSTGGRSRTIGAQESPASADA